MNRLCVRSILAFSFSMLLLAPALLADHTDDPSAVTVAGDLQSELGCPGDWQPDCAATQLLFDAEDTVWQGVFNVPAGSWQYKAPLNGSWDENYGLGAQLDGPNIPLNLGDAEDVKFYYDHDTHWITDNFNSAIATVAGSFQEELGCSGDWDPACLRSWLQDPDGDGTFVFETGQLPAGDYECKVTHDEDWAENYGQGGVQNGPNIPFTVPVSCADMRFEYDLFSHVLGISEAPPMEQPGSVTIAGTFQEELGCASDWQADCATTHLAFDAEDQVWQGTFSVPAGSWEYKATLNNSWDVNYGANATQGGDNIGMSLDAAEDVKFYYSHETNWVTSSENATIATLAGDFQSELGCPGDWQPSCLRSWLQDPDGDGIYRFSTTKLPAADYEVKVAYNESWGVSYGQGGAQNGANIPFSVPADCTEIFFAYDPVTHLLTIGTGPGGPKGNLDLAQAHWVSESTLAWNLSSPSADGLYALHWSDDGGLGIDGDGITGADDSIALTFDPAGLPASVTDKFPHLAGYAAFTIDEADRALAPTILKGQIAASAADSEATPIDATSIQIPGVLDDLFFYDGALGAMVSGSETTLQLWAPTAQSAALLLFEDSAPESVPAMVPMAQDPATGVWSVSGSDWAGMYYLFEVEVWAPSTGTVETNQVTDPYSLSLSANSARSQIVDLADLVLKPTGWDSLAKPALPAPEDVVVYELHLRDFSWYEPAVSEIERGTYRAFNQDGSYGMQHLSALADAGLTHIHLLPVFDVASVPEIRADQLTVDDAVLESYPPDSEEQQAAIVAIENDDGFNWGYDPWHFTVPEGSYATDPDGSQRILEFREMVRSLNESGLRVVMDVVYNHTNSAGQNDKSVLDKLVPGYYHRLNADGGIETSSCCPNTAAEHAMMEKLMIDSIVTWARDYKVDGFRFDLMGHHPKSTMLNIRAALDALTVAEDGVDGSEIYLYGEAWNFGEVANDARFVQATQPNLGGTGIGSFNDRIRDGVRGGGPFSGLQEQGFATGLYYDPNDTWQGNEGDQLNKLLARSDWIRVSLAGGLAHYSLIDRFGNEVEGYQVDYNGQSAGYTLDPQEIINYCAAHDNETFFDALQLKVPLGTSNGDRVRVQNMANDLIALGQGVPFFHAGQDLLRSKSMDRDSYNSGDWFNALDFTMSWNNWGVGLPVASKNEDNWPLMGPLLADPSLQVGSMEITATAAHFREMMRVRKSSRLFRLPSEAEVMNRMVFLNTGPAQLPGLIAMNLSDLDGSVDRAREQIVVLFNATDEVQDFTAGLLAGYEFDLHEVQQTSVDPVVQASMWDGDTSTFSVPPRTTTVFVALRPAQDQLGWLIGDIEELVDAGVLNKGQGKALSAKLENAIAALERNRDNAAANMVGAFINHVEALVTGGILTAEQGDALIAAAEDVLRAIG